MKRKCDCCGFEADDNEYEFEDISGLMFCGNCIEVKNSVNRWYDGI